MIDGFEKNILKHFTKLTRRLYNNYLSILATTYSTIHHWKLRTYQDSFSTIYGLQFLHFAVQSLFLYNISCSLKSPSFRLSFSLHVNLNSHLIEELPNMKIYSSYRLSLRGYFWTWYQILSRIYTVLEMFDMLRSKKRTPCSVRSIICLPDDSFWALGNFSREEVVAKFVKFLP